MAWMTAVGQYVRHQTELWQGHWLKAWVIMASSVMAVGALSAWYIRWKVRKQWRSEAIAEHIPKLMAKFQNLRGRVMVTCFDCVNILFCIDR